MSARRGVGLALAIGALALLGWRVSARAPRSAASVAPGSELEPAETQRAGAAPSATAAGARVPLDSGAVPTVELFVLEERTRAPVAGCELALGDLDAHLRRLTTQPTPLDGMERRRLFREHAATGRTDAEGRARLPLPIGRALVDARHERGLWGRLLLQGVPDGPVELLVAPDRELRARVRSLDGRPLAGIPVVLCRDGGRAFTERSGADGVAFFAHVQELAAEGATGTLGLGFPICAPALRFVDLGAVDLGAPPPEPVELVLPPTGALELELVDEAGAPVSGDRVDARMTAFLSAARAVERGCLGSGVELRFDEQGHARLAHVGLGLPLRLVLNAAERDPPRAPLTIDLDGPARAGETVRARLVWPAEQALPALTGRFVRADGAPWPAARLVASVRLHPYDARAAAPRELTVAADGRFRFALADALPPGGARTLHLRCLEPEALRGIEGRLELGFELPPGETALGDVLLDRGELLLSGQVVDDAGRPLPDARLELTRRVQLGEREHWPRQDSGGRIAADGRFELWAIPALEPPGGPLRLSARCQEHAPATLEVARGQAGLRVVLPRAGAVAGWVRLDPDLDPAEIALELNGRAVWMLPVHADGRFERDGLPPGVLSLSAWLRSASPSARERVVVEGLVVEPGETCRDPRLQGLALASAGTRLVLTVVDEAGRPVPDATVTSAEGVELRAGRDGRAVLRARELPLELAIRAYGYRPVALDDVDADRRVVLRAGPRVRLVLTGAPASGRDPERRILFWLRAVDADGRRGPRVELPPERTRFDADGRALVSLPAPGEYAFEPLLVWTEDGVGRSVQLGEEALRRVTVLDTDALQELRVELPAALLSPEEGD